jgi:hypothetical protein
MEYLGCAVAETGLLACQNLGLAMAMIPARVIEAVTAKDARLRRRFEMPTASTAMVNANRLPECIRLQPVCGQAVCALRA